MSLFNYESFLNELRDNPDKKHVIEKWEQYSSAKFLKDEPFYKYLKLFKTKPYKTPEELKNDFDWKLLLALVAASFSSEYHFNFDELEESSFDDDITKDMLMPELYITVQSGNQKVTKKISELWSFQILRLYEIYCEEQINLHALMLEDENEKNSIVEERKERILKFKIKSQELNNIVKRYSILVEKTNKVVAKQPRKRKSTSPVKSNPAKRRQNKKKEYNEGE